MLAVGYIKLMLEIQFDNTATYRSLVSTNSTRLDPKAVVDTSRAGQLFGWPLPYFCQSR